MKISSRRSVWAAALTALVVPAMHASPAAAETISDLYANGSANTGPFTFDAVVSAVLDTHAAGTTTTTNFVLQDATGSVETYQIPTTSYVPVVGQNLTVTAPNTKYKGGAEIDATGSTFVVNATGTLTPSHPVLTAAQVAATDTADGAVAPYAEAIVTVDDVRLSTSSTSVITPTALNDGTSYYLIDSTGSAVLYPYGNDTSSADAVAEANALNAATGYFANPIDVTGFVQPFGGVAELYPSSITPVPTPPCLYSSVLGLAGLGGLGTLKRRQRA